MSRIEGIYKSNGLSEYNLLRKQPSLTSEDKPMNEEENKRSILDTQKRIERLLQSNQGAVENKSSLAKRIDFGNEGDDNRGQNLPNAIFGDAMKGQASKSVRFKDESYKEVESVGKNSATAEKKLMKFVENAERVDKQWMSATNN